jgi:hypothetical protein
MTVKTGPVRIQKRRVAGWKGDRDPVYVGRPGVFGNPYGHRTREALARVPAADLVTAWELEARCSGDGVEHDMVWPSGMVTKHTIRYMTRAEIVETYRSALLLPRPGGMSIVHRRGRDVTVVDVALARRVLAGRDLSCWCEVGQPCHGDVLLWAANAPEDEIREAVAVERQAAEAKAARILALHPELAPKGQP